MNQPSSTIQAAGIAGFIAASILTGLKIWAPDIYAQIPPDYQGHLIVAITWIAGYFKRENVYHMLPKDTYQITPKGEDL